MNYKGYCLWADDIPTSEAPHYIVIISDADPLDYAFVVAISSIKYKDNGDEKYYDKACVIDVNDIVDDNGKKVLTKKSFVRYQYAREVNVNELLVKQISRNYKCRCRISDALLKRIQEGAKVSSELEPRFKKYFDLF